MVFYFSGTGNSLWVAEEIAKAFEEKSISIADELLRSDAVLTYPLGKEEKVIFVFPVHSWGPAVLVLRFIKKLKLDGYTGQPVFFVCACGDNCGCTKDIMRKALHKRGISLTEAYSIQMPNNYILMKGFDTDPKELEQSKLQKAPALLAEIVEDMKRKQHKEIYAKGNAAFLKSYIVYPLFRNFALGKNYFYAKENCIGCNKCVEVCPTKTITMVNKRPVWNNTCVQCTACIHHCPVQAIEYGKISIGKGRYLHP